jgi:hypothetical protein
MSASVKSGSRCLAVGFLRYLDQRTSSGCLGRSEKCQKLTQMPTGSATGSSRRPIADGYSVAGILPLGCEHVAVAILGQRAGVRHQPVSTRNGEFVGNRTIEDLPSRFDSHLRILVDSKLPLGIC